MAFENLLSILLAQYRTLWRAVLNAAINIRFTEVSRNFIVSYAPVIFLRVSCSVELVI
jgi:hypothetical protein